MSLTEALPALSLIHILEFAEFDEATPPVLKKPHSCPNSQEKDDSPENWQFKLKTYQKLKKVLEDEGLI